MQVKVTFRKDDTVVAEAVFEVESAQDLETMSHLALTEFRRVHPDIGLLDEGVWMKFDTASS